jgi:hypothetical protein
MLDSKCLQTPSFSKPIWRNTSPEETKNNTPLDIPEGWEKLPDISDRIIKVCPFFREMANDINRQNGFLEHLHLYCPSPILVEARNFCHQKIGDSLLDLYDFASLMEYNTLLIAIHAQHICKNNSN